MPGSPFKCNVVDPKKVVVKGLQDGLTLRHAATVAGMLLHLHLFYVSTLSEAPTVQSGILTVYI